MACLIAESARVHPRARVHEDAVIGPCCVIGPQVQIGRGTRLLSQVCLTGVIKIGEFNTLGPFVSIGDVPQDVSCDDPDTEVQIGDNNTIHERVTIHRGSEKEDGITRIGSNNQLFAGAHIAHDCKLCDRISIGVGSMLGGHVHVESHVAVMEKVGIHQFVTVGGDSFVGAHSKITQDVPRYMRVEGNPPIVRGINGRSLKQRGLLGAALAALREAHRMIYVVKMPLEQAATLLDDHGHLTSEVLLLVKFLESQHEGRMGRSRWRRNGI
jgi:UDP-N-acetylglucosamine acyltransferase